MDLVVLFTFLGVYAGMIAGGVRGLALDRTGIVLLGAIVLVATGRVTPQEAWEAVDVPTIALLFGLMVVSAQFRLGGFYTLVTRRLGESRASAPRFLLVLILVAGGLSALLANDIICLAMTPVLLEICQRRRLRPLPFLLGLACASNIGSAATLIGNPQNMLIGQVLGLSFAGYLLDAVVPATAGLFACWGIVAWMFRGRWEAEVILAPIDAPTYDGWQTGKGLAVLGGLVVLFLWEPLPREQAALIAAGLLLLSRRMASSRFLALVDWNLLLLFMGLFIVNHALDTSGLLASGLAGLRAAGVDLDGGAWLFGSTVILSNLVSNVPATMLLLPATQHPAAGPILALASTLAGNLILVGSIANLIVVEQARRLGVEINWREHARVGVPVTLATLALAAAWLALVV
jgi:Na+/H+ antiporter NhaD/arsenite permease-like protein